MFTLLFLFAGAG
uniref:Uncharacterized protein n=1 Tax=Anguilla anguilla TaxID=7936 RepID=A0A0E9T7I1_ANGAN